MLEAVGNIWDLAEGRALCLTTNGILSYRENWQGANVMGRGVALQAKQKFPSLPIALAARIRASGNLPYDLGTWLDKEERHYRIFSFPTKHSWKEDSDRSLIHWTLFRLAQLVHESNLETSVYLPRPGCGNGNLKWEEVRPWCKETLDDQFVVVEYREE